MSERHALVAIRGAVMAALFVTLWVWLASLVRRLDPLFGVAPPTWMQPVGWFLLIVGLSIGLSCVFLFLTAGRGTPAPFDPPKVFVATGPYRYVRNPMYVGAVLAFIGGGFAFRSVSILLLAFLFWTLSHVMVVFNEEPALTRRFGESFEAYKRQTNRWLPAMPAQQLRDVAS